MAFDVHGGMEDPGDRHNLMLGINGQDEIVRTDTMDSQIALQQAAPHGPFSNGFGGVTNILEISLRNL
jgi:hypothetical protein